MSVQKQRREGKRVQENKTRMTVAWLFALHGNMNMNMNGIFRKKNVWQIIFNKTARKFMKDEPLTILFCSDTLSIFCKYITNPANEITFKIRNKRQKDYS